MAVSRGHLVGTMAQWLTHVSRGHLVGTMAVSRGHLAVTMAVSRGHLGTMAQWLTHVSRGHLAGTMAVSRGHLVGTMAQWLTHVREENLKAHMKSHSALPPLVCPLCNQSFSQRADITEHLKTHFSSPQDQVSPTPSQDGSDRSSTVNGSAVPSTSADLGATGVNGIHDDDDDNNQGSLDLVIPAPSATSSKCKMA
ncbi:hypothetical protein ACOMHN_002293 [Nucella lapillus]